MGKYFPASTLLAPAPGDISPSSGPQASRNDSVTGFPSPQLDEHDPADPLLNSGVVSTYNVTLAAAMGPAEKQEQPAKEKRPLARTVHEGVRSAAQSHAAPPSTSAMQKPAAHAGNRPDNDQSVFVKAGAAFRLDQRSGEDDQDLDQANFIGPTSTDKGIFVHDGPAHYTILTNAHIVQEDAAKIAELQVEANRKGMELRFHRESINNPTVAVTMVPKKGFGPSINNDEDELTMESNTFTTSAHSVTENTTQTKAAAKAKPTTAPPESRATKPTGMPTKPTSSAAQEVDSLLGGAGRRMLSRAKTSLAAPPTRPKSDRLCGNRVANCASSSASSPAANTARAANLTSTADAIETNLANRHLPNPDIVDLARLPARTITPVSTDANELKRKTGKTQSRSTVKKQRISHQKPKPAEKDTIMSTDGAVETELQPQAGGDGADAKEEVMLLSDD